MPQVDLTLQPIHNATTPISEGERQATPRTGRNKSNTRAKPVKKQGVRYMTVSGASFQDPKYNIQTIQEYQKSYYGAAMTGKLLNLIFPGDIKFTIKDAEGKEDPDLSKIVQAMAYKIGIWDEARGLTVDLIWGGAYLASPEWDWVSVPFRGSIRSVYGLTDIQRLPPESFVDPVTKVSETYSELLQGITIGQSGEPEYYQTVEGKQNQITNIVCITNPLVRTLGGEPIIRPLLILFAYLKHCWEMVIRTVNRIGTPIIFIKITDGDTDDDDYAETILKDWGPNTGFQIPENFEIVNLNFPEPKTPTEAIELLSRMVIDFFSPASFVQNPAATLSSSDVSSGEQMESSIKGFRTIIENGLESIFEPFLRVNGLADRGYTLEVEIASSEVDRSAVLLQVVDKGFTTKSLLPGERREVLRKVLGPAAGIVQDLSDEELESLEQRIAPQTAQPLFGGGTFVQNAVKFYNALPKKKIKTIDDVINRYHQSLREYIDSYLDDAQAGLKSANLKKFDIIDYTKGLKNSVDRLTGERIIPLVDEVMDSAAQYGGEATEWQLTRLGIGRNYSLQVSPEVLDILKCRQMVLLENLTDSITKGIVTEISEGMLSGEGIGDLTRRIKGVEGFTERYKNQAETIARTETLTAMNTGIVDTMAGLGIEQVQVVAAIDDRTCDECAEDDMKVYPIGDAPYLPRHPDCRCTLIAVPPEGVEYVPFTPEEIEKFRKGNMTPTYRPKAEA